MGLEPGGLLFDSGGGEGLFLGQGDLCMQPFTGGLRLESRMLALATHYGDVEIREDDLSSLTDAELKKFRISRTELHRAFAEGAELMKSRSDRVRPVAHKTFDGTWRVDLFRFSPITDPLMQRKSAGSA